VFYSARLRFVILVDDGRPRKRNTYNESVVVFRSRSWNDAMKRALHLGRKAQTIYKNGKGQRVRWALVEVITLDLVGGSVDGKEVTSRFEDRVSARPISPRTRFAPEKSRPGQSI